MILSVCLFVLRLNVPVNNFQSFRNGATASWVLPVLSGNKVSCSRTQHGGGGFRPPQPLVPESDALPMSHRAPPVSNEYSHHGYHKISKVYFELNTRTIGWSAEECAFIALCVQGYIENRPAGCLQSVIQNTTE